MPEENVLIISREKTKYLRPRNCQDEIYLVGNFVVSLPRHFAIGMVGLYMHILFSLFLVYTLRFDLHFLCSHVVLL